MTLKLRIPIIVILLFTGSCTNTHQQSDAYRIGELLYSDSFDGGLSHWSAEMETPSGSSVKIKGGQLHLSSFGGGTTLWFLQKLDGSVMIEYNATAMPIGGVADSVSDVNSFWMLTDLKHPEDILADSSSRGGRFKSYHTLPGYYAGKGAGRNTRTTFKKHDMSGNGSRIDWGILTDQEYMLRPSFPHKIQLIYCDGPDSALVQYICDESLYFEKWDSEPCRSGWFAFRVYNASVMYDNFKVYRLVPSNRTQQKAQTGDTIVRTRQHPHP